MNKEFVEQLHAFFLQLLDYPPSDPIPLDTQAFSLLLHFSLAHGYMHLLIPLMQKYVDAVVGSGDEDTLGIPCAPLFYKIDQTLVDLEMENAAPLTLRIEEAEGFAKPREELSGLLHHEMVNPDSSESTAYTSKEDGTALDLVLTDMKGRHFNLRKIGIAKKADKNVSPHLCLLFCVSSQHLDPHTHRPTDSKKLIELYAKFNSWTMDDWKKSEEQKPRDPDQPVACFDLTLDDWSGSCTVETCTLPCYCCVIKLLKPKKESGAEDEEQKKTFSVYAMQIHGEISPSIELQMMHNALAEFHSLPAQDSAPVESSTVVLRLFTGLIALVRNQTAVINRNSDWNQGKKLFLTYFVNVPHLNLDSLSFLDVWKLFLSMEKFANTFKKHRTLTLEIVTHFLLICMPYFNTFNRQNKPKEDEDEFKAEVLDHISRILNDPSVSDDVISSLSGVLEAGVTILFPKQEVRVQQLFEGVKLSTSTEDHPRAEIKIVSALIHYFSTQEVNKLLGLPSPCKLDFEREIDINMESILEIMTPLFSILHQRTLQQVDAFVSQTDVRIPRINIVPLLSSLQSVILNWSYALALTDKATEHSRTVAKVLLCRYLNLIERELSQLLRLLTQHIKVEKILSAFEHGLISVLLPELVCALHVFHPVQGVRDFVLHMFQGFVHKFTELSHAIPNFRTVYRQPQQDPECLLGKWERESPHFTYNRKEENETFSTPGAAYFLIEFDNRSKTESGYEQLEFTDKDGKKYKYAGRVGSNSWPFSVYIKGDILTFRYKTDGGEFGYKMSVSAYGAAVSLHWFRDLYFSLAALFGRFCGENLKLSQGSGGKSSLTEEEVILLKSDIGKSIFRGGLQRSRFVRSYSGMHQTNSASDGLITQFLSQMISEDASAKALDFLQVCQTTFKQPRYGGYLADKAVRATFAALLWHSQELRDEIIRFESKKETGKISSRTTATYRLAESVRPGLLAAKQVLIQKKEDSPDKTIDPDKPLIDCIDKALFLLKFAGLSRSDGEADKASPKRGKLHRKKSKVGTAQVVEKDPYMDIIVNFVRSDSYSIARIQEDMEERAKSAQNRSLTYNFTRDFVLFATQTAPEAEPHQILSVFLTACFSECKGTPPHYGGNLDGCGLELETRVRESFYNLSQKLFQSVWNEGDLFDISKLPSNATFLLSILHLLLNNIWNDFDFNFLLEHKLPSVLYTTSVTLLTRKLDEKADKESKELRAVEEYLGWISLIQFHSLSLQLSARIQDSTTEVDESYLHNAIQLFTQCIRELIKSIRAGISSAKLKEAKKKKEEEAKEKSEKKDKGSKKEAEKSESSGKKEVTNGDTEVSKKEENGVQESSEALTISELVLDALIREVETASSKRSALNLTNDLGLKEKLEPSPGVKGASLSLKANDIDSLSDAEKEQVVAIPNGPSELVNGTAESADETPKTKPFEDKFEFSASTLDTTVDLEKEPRPDKGKPSRADLSDAQMSFGEDNLMRNICALGGLAPINPGHSRWCSPGDSIQEVICREVLPLLLEVVQTACLKNAEKLQLLSVSLLVRFIRRVDPQLVDEVMTTISSSPPLPPSSAPGLSYILFLTNLGTSFLQKHKLIQATTVGHYLQQLLTEHPWMQAYMYNLQKHLDLLPNTAGPVCIFHLLVLAGFPELPAFGMRVEVEQKNSPPLPGLMVQAKEGNSYEVALENTRSTRNFLEKDVKIKPSTLAIEDKTSLLPILKLTVDCLRIAEKSVEQLYVSFLLQKTVLNYVQGDKSGESIHEVLKSGMLDLLAKLACKPTGVDKKWQVAELEHLCIRSYQPDKNRGNTPSPLENEASEESKEKSTEVSKAEQRDPLGNLSDSVRETFFNLQGAFTCSLSVIRAAYEKAEKKEETLIENVQRWLTDDKGFQVPEDILEKAKDWEPLEEEPTPEVPEEMDETLDKGLPKYTPISIENKDFTITKDQDKNKKEKEILIPPADTFEGEYASSRKDSLELFYSMENDKLKRSQMKKLLSGLNVLQARHTLFSLILHWNLEVPLCTGFLETMDVSRLFSLLQCAHKSLDESTFDKMLDQLVTHISNTTKKALGVEASKVLGPIKACTLTKESTHPNTKTIVESKIQIKNAIQYIITPDAQSGFQPDDTLLFGSDSQFVENRKEISGTDFKAVNQIVISAKNLHCKVKTPHPNNEWGWKFNVVVVTAGVLSCFDSACKLLERILSKLENSTPLLPLASVWENLFIACCFHPDEERFKIVSLMGLVLKLFTTQNSLRRSKDPDEVVSKKDPEQQIDLTLLRPLWNYYSKLIDQHDNKKTALMNLKVPPIARMLTDLFTQVELCAGACGMERELMMSQVTDESMDAILRVGIRNVGLVSVAIDADNIIKDKFIQAKSTTVDLFKELPFSTNSDSEKKSLSLTPAASTEDDSTEESLYSDDSSSYYSDWSI